MTDESHEPFVAPLPNDPDDEPLPGEGADDSTSDDLATFGLPEPEVPAQPDYFSHDAPIEDADIAPATPEHKE